MSTIVNNLINAIANKAAEADTLYKENKDKKEIEDNICVIAKAAIDFNNTQLLKAILADFPIRSWEWLFTYQTPAGTPTLSYCEIHSLSDEVYDLLRDNGAMPIHAQRAS